MASQRAGARGAEAPATDDAGADANEPLHRDERRSSLWDIRDPPPPSDDLGSAVVVGLTPEPDADNPTTPPRAVAAEISASKGAPSVATGITEVDRRAHAAVEADLAVGDDKDRESVGDRGLLVSTGALRDIAPVGKAAAVSSPFGATRGALRERLAAEADYNKAMRRAASTSVRAERAESTSRALAAMQKKPEMRNSVDIEAIWQWLHWQPVVRSRLFERKMPLDNNSRLLCTRIMLVRAPRGTLVMRQEEPGHSFYVIFRGEVAVHHYPTAATDRTHIGFDGSSGALLSERDAAEHLGPRVAVLSAGASVGDEPELLIEGREEEAELRRRRVCSVVSRGVGGDDIMSDEAQRMLASGGEDVAELLSINHDDYEKCQARVEAAHRAEWLDRAKMLAQMQAFASWPLVEVVHLAQWFTSATYAPGDVIFSPGDHVTHVYLLVEGELTVWCAWPRDVSKKIAAEVLLAPALAGEVEPTRDMQTRQWTLTAQVRSVVAAIPVELFKSMVLSEAASALYHSLEFLERMDKGRDTWRRFRLHDRQATEFPARFLTDIQARFVPCVMCGCKGHPPTKCPIVADRKDSAAVRRPIARMRRRSSTVPMGDMKALIEAAAVEEERARVGDGAAEDDPAELASDAAAGIIMSHDGSHIRAAGSGSLHDDGGNTIPQHARLQIQASRRHMEMADQMANLTAALARQRSTEDTGVDWNEESSSDEELEKDLAGKLTKRLEAVQLKQDMEQARRDMDRIASGVGQIKTGIVETLRERRRSLAENQAQYDAIKHTSSATKHGALARRASIGRNMLGASKGSVESNGSGPGTTGPTSAATAAGAAAAGADGAAAVGTAAAGVATASRSSSASGSAAGPPELAGELPMRHVPSMRHRGERRRGNGSRPTAPTPAQSTADLHSHSGSAGGRATGDNGSASNPTAATGSSGAADDATDGSETSADRVARLKRELREAKAQRRKAAASATDMLDSARGHLKQARRSSLEGFGVSDSASRGAVSQTEHQLRSMGGSGPVHSTTRVLPRVAHHSEFRTRKPGQAVRSGGAVRTGGRHVAGEPSHAGIVAGTRSVSAHDVTAYRSGPRVTIAQARTAAAGGNTRAPQQANQVGVVRTRTKPHRVVKPDGAQAAQPVARSGKVGEARDAAPVPARPAAPARRASGGRAALTRRRGSGVA